MKTPLERLNEYAQELEMVCQLECKAPHLKKPLFMNVSKLYSSMGDIEYNLDGVFDWMCELLNIERSL